MSIIFEQYEERLHRLKRNPGTIRSFNQARRKMEQYLTDNRIPAEKLDSHELEDFLAELDIAPTTKRLYLTHIGAAYRYAHRRGTIPRDPTVDVKLASVPDTEPRIIPTAALREMKERLFTDREWMLWHLLAYTGMRRAEILGLKWEGVKLDTGTITVVGKGGKLRHIPIHPALAEVLMEQDAEADGWVLRGRARKGTPKATSIRTFHEVLGCITKSQFTAHDFRRTVASSLYMNGVEGGLIDKIMGWSPRLIRMKYYVNVADEQLQRAILKLYVDDPL